MTQRFRHFTTAAKSGTTISKQEGVPEHVQRAASNLAEAYDVAHKEGLIKLGDPQTVEKEHSSYEESKVDNWMQHARKLTRLLKELHEASKPLPPIDLGPSLTDLIKGIRPSLSPNQRSSSAAPSSSAAAPGTEPRRSGHATGAFPAAHVGNLPPVSGLEAGTNPESDDDAVRASRLLEGEETNWLHGMINHLDTGVPGDAESDAKRPGVPGEVQGESQR